jgi:hypothetical protein
MDPSKNIPPELQQFVEDRNEALLSLDETKIREFGKKYEIPMSDKPIVFWASIHKARMEVTSFSERVREKSRRWLLAHNFSPGIGES